MKDGVKITMEVVVVVVAMLVLPVLMAVKVVVTQPKSRVNA